MLVERELKKLNSVIIDSVLDNNLIIHNDIADFLSAKSKRIRPMLIFLFAKSLQTEISDKIYNLASSVELIHNATLIHDDIIDNAKIRRGKASLNCKLGNNLSILAGDILLSIALLQLSKCNNAQILGIFSDCLYKICKGEINQNINSGKLPEMEEYIQKSEYKTAQLFNAGLVSLFHLENITEKDNIIEFSRNFGIAFQIKDDLLNIINSDSTKPFLSDIYNEIYTAPVIFLNHDKNIEDLSKEEIIKLVKEPKYKTKTLELIKKYALIAIKAIDFIPNNQYKEEIIKITQNLYKAGNNE